MVGNSHNHIGLLGEKARVESNAALILLSLIQSLIAEVNDEDRPVLLINVCINLH